MNSMNVWTHKKKHILACDLEYRQIIGDKNGSNVNQLWYFVTQIVLTYCEKKISSDREKLLKFEAEIENLQN